jgi:hypothetical protein
VSSATAGTTDAPTIKIGTTNITEYDARHVKKSTLGGVVYYDATALNLSSGSVTASTTTSQNIYVNSTYGTTSASHNITSGDDIIRVIVQDGNAAPYIAVIKF